MNRFVFVALLVMAWGYWELSGGTDFVPEERMAVAPAAAAEQPVTVTRADTSELNAVPDVAEPAPAIEIPAADIAGLTDPAGTVADAVAAVVATEVEAAAEPAAQPAPDPIPAAAPVADLRVVTGDRVNLREGPGTGFSAIDQLASGTIAEVIETGSDGWVRIQVQGTAVSGWMSADFLIPLNG